MDWMPDRNKLLFLRCFTFYSMPYRDIYIKQNKIGCRPSFNWKMECLFLGPRFVNPA